MISVADDRVHDGEGVAEQEVGEDLDQVPDVVELVALLEQLQHQQHQRRRHVDGQGQHLEHAPPVVPPRAVQRKYREEQHQQVQHEHAPLPGDVVIVLVVPEEDLHLRWLIYYPGNIYWHQHCCLTHTL